MVQYPPDSIVLPIPYPLRTHGSYSSPACPEPMSILGTLETANHSKSEEFSDLDAPCMVSLPSVMRVLATDLPRPWSRPDVFRYLRAGHDFVSSLSRRTFEERNSRHILLEWLYVDHRPMGDTARSGRIRLSARPSIPRRMLSATHFQS